MLDTDDQAPPPEIPARPAVTVAQFTPPRSPDEAVARARTALGRGVKYQLGAGQVLRPWQPIGGAMDCSEFVCWSLGLSKLTSDPLYRRVNGGWRNTTAIHRDGLETGGVFTRVRKPRPGDVLVRPTVGRDIGHTALVTRVEPNGDVWIIDCSSKSWRTKRDAIQERPYVPSQWGGAIFVRLDLW